MTPWRREERSEQRLMKTQYDPGAGTHINLACEIAMTTTETPARQVSGAAIASPVRVTLSRKRGWRMPPNTVKVCRGTGWGNPWKVGEWSSTLKRVMTQADAVLRFEAEISDGGCLASLRAAAPKKLRGKNLACWCKPGTPCHADVLLRLSVQPSGIAGGHRLNRRK